MLFSLLTLVLAAAAASPNAPIVVRPNVAAAVADLQKRTALAPCLDDVRLAFTDAYIAANADYLDGTPAGGVAMDAMTTIDPRLSVDEKQALAAFALADTALIDDAVPANQSPWSGAARAQLRVAVARITAIDERTVARIVTKTQTLPCHMRKAQQSPRKQ
jgi:hypothetical protein